MTTTNVDSNVRMEQVSNDETNLNGMDWFGTIFDVPDHLDRDGNNDDLENILEEYNTEFDFDFIHTNVDEEEMITDENITKQNSHVVTPRKEIMRFEERILSQELSQLSTNDENDRDDLCVRQKKRPISTPSTPDVTSKKIRILDDIENDSIPSYLQATNELFDTIMTDYIMKRTSSTAIITVEDLRQLASLKHTIATVRIRRELWTAYLKSGMGLLKTNESSKTTVDQRRWPAEIKERSKLNVDDNSQDEQQRCEDFVNEHLQELTKTIEQHQREYEAKKNSSRGLTEEMEKAIARFVQQYGIRAREMKLAYRIGILYYDYDAHILELEYQRHKPTQDQIQIAQHLYELRYDYVQSKQELVELKQRVVCNKPPAHLFSPIASSASATNIIDTSTDARNYQLQIDAQEKKRQQNMTDAIALTISEQEQELYERQTSLNEEIGRTSVQTDQNSDGLSGNLIDLIYRHFQIINKKLEYVGNFRINYYLKSHYGDEQESIGRTRQRLSPTMIIDTSSHHLTDEQVQLLNRGPIYLLPYQMYVSSSLSMKDMIQQQYKLLQHHLSIIFAKFKINPARSMFINKQIKDLYTSTFSLPLPLSIHQRTVYERQLVQSIREHLTKNRSIILRRTADRRNVFYIGNRQEFEEKANKYMINTNIFEFCEIIDPMNLEHAREYLIKKIRSMNSELEKIFNSQKSSNDLLKKLYIEVDKVQWSYLYFLPDVSEDEVSLKPFIVSQKSVTSQLAKFLNDLLQPVVQRHTELTNFINGADFIRKLNRYIDKDNNKRQYFHVKTNFATIYISNYYTMASHATMLTTLQDFLNNHLAIPFIENISVNRIVDLTSLFLKNNFFYYDNIIYRCTRGCPESFELSKTLAHIYTMQWQKVLFHELSMDTEFYGRYQNQIFFTWNRSTDELRQIFRTFNSEHRNLQLDVKIGSTVYFSNVHVENFNGELCSRVYHNPNNQKYTLPYALDNTIIAHSHWFRSALIRAVHYCTSVFDFHQERTYLEVTCLANGYSLEFIERRVHHFFTHFDAMSLRFVLKQNVYEQLRHRLFNFISEQQQFCRQNQELQKNNQLVRLSYLYAYGAQRQFQQKLKEILDDNLTVPATQQYSKRQLKIKLTSKHQYSLNALLSEQKPIHPLLNGEKRIF